MIIEILQWAAIGFNVSAGVHIYRKARYIEPPLGSVQKQLVLEQQIEDLNDDIARLKGPDQPFLYTWDTRVIADEANEVRDWLASHDPASYNLEIKELDFRRIGGCVEARVAFATQDKKLAMLFKLTFGGAA